MFTVANLPLPGSYAMASLPLKLCFCLQQARSCLRPACGCPWQACHYLQQLWHTVASMPLYAAPLSTAAQYLACRVLCGKHAIICSSCGPLWQACLCLVEACLFVWPGKVSDLQLQGAVWQACHYLQQLRPSVASMPLQLSGRGMPLHAVPCHVMWQACGSCMWASVASMHAFDWLRPAFACPCGPSVTSSGLPCYGKPAFSDSVP